MARAKKSLGQNFLVDPNLQRKIVRALDPQPADTVIEIGPGTGALTQHLAGKVGRLIAVEKDDALARALAQRYEDADSVRILHADALETDIDAILGAGDGGTFKIIGNIPYNITTPLIFHLLAFRPPPERIVLMIQKEVADRILAEPGQRVYGALSVGVRLVADVERLFPVGRKAFRPAPDVDSTVIRIRPHRPPRLDRQTETDARTLTRVAFGWRRKQLQNILRNAPEYRLDASTAERLLHTIGTRGEARPETLTPEAFTRLARALRQLGLPAADPPPSPATSAPIPVTSTPDPMDDEQARRRLVGLISHELRSPIAAILGYQELLSEGLFGPVEPRAKGALGRIGGAARQLRSLVDGIELLLGEAAAQPVTDATVDPATTLRQALAAAAEEADLRGTRIDADEVPPLPPLRIDPDAFSRALFHALAAPMKAAPGEPIRVTAACDPTHIRIRIFGPHLRQHDSADDPALPATGAGLRLAIARRTLRALGGDLHIVEDGAGDVVEVVLTRTESSIDAPEVNP